MSDPEDPGIEGEQRNMAHPPIKIPLPFYHGTKQWDLHELQLKHCVIVNDIGENRGGLAE